MKKIVLATTVIAAFATSAFAMDDMKKEAAAESANPANAPHAADSAPAASDKLDTKAPAAGKTMYTLSDKKTEVEIDATGMATVGGKKAPAGVHHTDTGKTITVDKNGMATVK